MYENFYGFRERPFTLLPDPDFLFLNEKHRAALDMLETAVSGHSGFCVISGEIGAGKTTLIRELLNRLDADVTVGLVSNTHPTFGELLQWVMAAYGLPCGDGDKLELHKRFVEFAIRQYAQNKHTLLIIDEAQNLTVQALEELRMLSNVNSENDLVLQVILVGQHQLRDKLQQPELEQFSQRITLNYHLEELNQADTCSYIKHRVSHAGGEPGLFSADACQAVYRISGGIPRLINRLCDLSLVYGCTAESRVITAELVDRVGEDQRMSTLHDIPRVDRVTTKTEETAQPAQASAEENAGLEPSAATIMAGEPPARVSAGPEPTQEADSLLSSDTIVGALSPALLTELDTAVSQQEVATESAASSDLHRLVVDAEQKKSTRSERSALWLLLGVVIMAGGTGWMMRDFWSAGLIVAPNDIKEQAASSAIAQPSIVAKEVPVAPVASADSEGTRPEAGLPETLDSQQPFVADSTDLVEKGAGMAVAGENATPPQAVAAENATPQKEVEAERVAEQRDTELRREAEKTARLKKESDRMVRERRAAEKKLAKQRTERKELERKARLERKKMAAAKAAAKKLAEERTRAEALLSEAAAAKNSSPQKSVRPAKVQASVQETGPSAYEDDDGDAIVRETKERLASDADASVPGTLPSAYEQDDGDAIVQDDKDEEVEFTANPCQGPTARFLSTCR